MSHNSDMIKLVKLMEGKQQYAGEEVGQKPGDQVRGTDKAKVGGKDHPFKGRLVGEDTTLEDKLAKKYQDFKEIQAKEKEEKKKEVEEAKQRLDPKCWDGYKKQGTKMKGDTRVNNCVPESVRIGSNLPQSDIETFGLEKGRGYKINTPKDWKPGDRPRAMQQLIPTQDKKDHIRSRLGKHKSPVLPEQDVAEGKDEKIVQLKKDYKTAMHWSENARSPQEREEYRRKALKIKNHLEKQYKQGVAEGPGFDKWADERAASQLHKLKKPHPETWHDVDKKLGKATDKMSQAEKVKKGLAHPDTLNKQGVAEGLDPIKKRRLYDLIELYRDATEPNDYYDRDIEDPDEVIAMIRSEFGDKIAGQVEAGADKMHYPRHDIQRSDPLGWKKPVDRITKAGKMYKQDSDYMKNTIKSRYKLSGKSATESVEEGFGEEHSPVTQAITRRIIIQRTDLLAKYGPEKVAAAIDDVADFVGDVDEIGSSDVSGWVRQVEQSLSGMGEGMTADQKLSELGATPPPAPAGTATAAPTTGNVTPTAGSVSPDEQTALNKIQTNPAMKQQLDKLMTQATPGAATKPMELNPEQEDALEKIKANAGLKTQYDKIIKQANPQAKV